MSYTDVLNTYKSTLQPYQAEVEEQKRRLEEALAAYTPRVGREATIGGQATEALRQRDIQMSGFRTAQRGREEALAETRPQMRAEYTKQPGESGYINPYRVESLISEAETGRQSEIAGLEDIMQTRMGTRGESISRIIAAYTAGTERAKAEVGGRQGMLDEAQQGLTYQTDLATQAYNQGYKEVQDKLLQQIAEEAEKRRQLEWGQQFSYQQAQEAQRQSEWQTTYDYNAEQNRLNAILAAEAEQRRQLEWQTSADYTRALTEQARRPAAGVQPTAAEKAAQAARDRLNADVSRGVTIEDLMMMYADELSFSEIMSAYNASSRYGEAQRSPQDYMDYYQGLY